MPGGQPSTTQPIATPWLSPNEVTQNSLPSVLPDMGSFVARRIGSLAYALNASAADISEVNHASGIAAVN